MTVICKGAQTKKELVKRAKLHNEGQGPQGVNFSDPAIKDAHHRGLPFGFGAIVEGTKFVCTNHPARSWFASVERKDGKVVVK
jgi:hypothetical protein